MLSLFPRDVLDEIWDLIESVSEGFPTYYGWVGLESIKAMLCYQHAGLKRCKTEIQISVPGKTTSNDIIGADMIRYYTLSSNYRENDIEVNSSKIA